MSKVMRAWSVPASATVVVPGVKVLEKSPPSAVWFCTNPSPENSSVLKSVPVQTRFTPPTW